ncbi:40S ribosomal protein S5-1 [Hordeum vulgare]|nr:40S ribosomal protein S5-1 [Hordeum vulgare]
MDASSSSKDKFFDNVINPYLREVMQHPQAIQMREGVLRIHDVQEPKGTGSVEASFEAMEQEIFWCKGMVERGLNANHLMIVDYTRDLKVDGKFMKNIVFSLNEQINFLHSQIHGLQSQVFEYEARFKAHSRALGQIESEIQSRRAANIAAGLPPNSPEKKEEE